VRLGRRTIALAAAPCRGPADRSSAAVAGGSLLHLANLICRFSAALLDPRSQPIYPFHARSSNGEAYLSNRVGEPPFSPAILHGVRGDGLYSDVVAAQGSAKTLSRKRQPSMSKKCRASNRTTPRGPAAERSGNEPQSQEIARVLGKVKALLQDQRPKEALDAIARSRLRSPWITNAAGVCQLRLGNKKQAVLAFQGLVLYSGVLLKPDAPAVFKTNYAAALLASDNLSGCLGVLNEIHDEENPTVQRLRGAIQRWKRGLSFWQTLRWYCGDDPGRKVLIDFPLGDVE